MLTSRPGYSCVIFWLYFSNQWSFKSLCRMTSLIVIFSYQIKFNISTSKRATNILLKKLFYDFNWCSQCNKILQVKFRFINTLKVNTQIFVHKSLSIEILTLVDPKLSIVWRRDPHVLERNIQLSFNSKQPTFKMESFKATLVNFKMAYVCMQLTLRACSHGWFQCDFSVWKMWTRFFCCRSSHWD